MRMSGITVIDVMRQMGVELDPEITWSVGARVRDIYEQRYGQLPAKALRQKTNAGGTHCLAVYPESMRATIVSIIRTHQTNKAAQGRFEF